MWWTIPMAHLGLNAISKLNHFNRDFPLLLQWLELLFDF